MTGTVKVRAELHPFFTDFAQRAEAEDLKTAAVGKNGAGPGGELVQAAAPGHQFVAGAQVQMVGIAEYHGRADGGQVVRSNGLDRAYCAHGHEDRCGNRAVCRAQDSCAGGPVGMLYGKNGIGHAAHSICKRAGMQAVLRVPGLQCMTPAGHAGWMFDKDRMPE